MAFLIDEGKTSDRRGADVRAQKLLVAQKMDCNCGECPSHYKGCCPPGCRCDKCFQGRNHYNRICPPYCDCNRCRGRRRDCHRGHEKPKCPPEDTKTLIICEKVGPTGPTGPPGVCPPCPPSPFREVVRFGPSDVLLPPGAGPELSTELNIILPNGEEVTYVSRCSLATSFQSVAFLFTCPNKSGSVFVMYVVVSGSSAGSVPITLNVAEPASGTLFSQTRSRVFDGNPNRLLNYTYEGSANALVPGQNYVLSLVVRVENVRMCVHGATVEI